MPIELARLTGVGGGASSVTRAAKAAATGGADAGGFAEQLGSLIDGVEEASADANSAVTGMVNKTGDVHDAMIALQRAEMSLQLTVQIRNKLVTAYNEIMRMPI
jgi:flagellar hook-basal body complex protein FliE